MNLMKMTLAAAVITLAAAGPVFAADSAAKEHKAEKQRIEADAKAAKEKCKDMKGNAKDMCMAEAKGNEKVAKAELDMKQKDTPKARYNVAAAKADRDHDIAREKCDEMKGKEKETCQKDAKNARSEAKKQAKAERESAEGKKARKS